MASGVVLFIACRLISTFALHSSIGIADRRGLLTYLTHKRVYVDVGRLSDAIAERLRDEVLNASPKPPEESYILKAIVEHGTRSDAAAPPGSLAALFPARPPARSGHGHHPAEVIRLIEAAADRSRPKRSRRSSWGRRPRQRKRAPVRAPADHEPPLGILGIVAEKVWTAEELEAMTPAEQDAIFESSLITDLTQVPEEFLERVRSRVLAHIAETETPKQ